jgi:hypothetical protein
MKFKDCKGQSVAEYAVVLALIIIIAVTVHMGIGQSSRDRLANISAVNTAFEADSGTASTGGPGLGAGSSGRNSGGDQGLGSGSESNQVNKATGLP